MSKMQQALLFTGGSIPTVFWATTVLCGILLGDYNHLSGLVSELGAVGTKTQLIFTVGLALCSILSFVFVLELFFACRAVQISPIPVVIILSYSFSIGGAAIFPMPLRLHGLLGLPSILLVLSPLLSFIFWGRMQSMFRIKIFSILCFLIMSLGFLSFFPVVLENYPGMKQRVFHLGWSIWFIYLSYSFSRLFIRRSNEVFRER